MLLSDQPKINFAFGVHNHQPVGNWDSVIEESYQRAYLPFIEVLERHSGIRTSIHYTGFLLEWLSERHPEFIAKLKVLVKRGQLELLTGAYYEPILAAIPDEDKHGQIRRLSERIDSLTGDRPEGMWLAERVWEPHLVKPIAEAGAHYTVLDDIHFKAAGLRGTELFGYYQSEEQGRTIEIFALNSQLRSMIPFSSPEKVIETLRSFATPDGGRIAVCLDDGEKLGRWPNTYQLVYSEGWLDRFFTLLEDNAEWISMTTLRDYRRNRRPWGRIYIPTCSYPQMQEWALPTDLVGVFQHARHEVDMRYQDFLRGGSWRNFLVKYPESNNLHKKMLLVSSKVAAASEAKHPVSALGPDAEAMPSIDAAVTSLYQAQTNDPYWHGAFGGLYLSHLRSTSYQNLLQAETIADRILHEGREFCEISERDFDCDGAPEILISTASQNLYFRREGGALFELDFKPKAFNLIDTLARRPEPYHNKIAGASEGIPRDRMPHSLHEMYFAKEPGLERLIFHDWYRRISFIDHFLHPDSRLETFYNVTYGEQGDFVNQHYRPTIERDSSGTSLTLTRDGHVWVGTDFWPVSIAKRVTVPKIGPTARVDYAVTNGRDLPVSLWFGVEFAFNLLAGHSDDRVYVSPGQTIAEPHLASKGELHDFGALGARDEVQGIEFLLSWSKPTTVWRFPIETVSMSESGFERVYQGSVFMPHWKIDLPPGGTWNLTFEQRVSEL